MRRFAILFALFALASVVAVAPVIAAPEKWTPVTATQTAGSGAFSGIKLNDGGVFFYDAVGAGVVVLHTPTVDYTFASSSVLNGTINTKTDGGVMHFKMLWEYKVNDAVVGGFEGEEIGKSTTTKYSATGIPLPMYSTNIYHVVLHGFGEFDGQMLKLDGIRPTQTVGMTTKPVEWEGFLLKG